MTKKWSGTRSEPLKTKRQASKEARALDPIDLEDIDGDLAEIEAIAEAQSGKTKP